MSEMFAPYAHALAALALFGLLSAVLIPLSMRGRNAEARAECGKPKRNYQNNWYRAERALANAMENTGPFVAAVVAAILVGAAPFWVNLLASVAVSARIAMAVVHTMTTNEPLRSLCFVVSFFATLFLGILAFWGALSL